MSLNSLSNPSGQASSIVGPVLDTGGAVFNVKAYGAVGDGVTDDSAAVNAAVAAAGAVGGGTVVFQDGKTYGFAGILSATAKNILFLGYGATLVSLPSMPINTPLLFGATFPAYENCTFDGLEFDGRNYLTPASTTTRSVNMSRMKNVLFRRCIFTDLANASIIADALNLSFEQCRFYGTRAGVMQAGVQEPAAVVSATYTDALLPATNLKNLRVVNSDFLFQRQGIVGGSTTANPSHGFKALGCTFRADWFCSPYVRARYASGCTVDLTNPSAIMLNVPSGLNALGLSSTVRSGVAFRLECGTAAAFDSVSGNSVTFTLTFENSVVALRIGDVIETADGRRGEIVGVTSTSSVSIDCWEAIDTFRPISPPGAATAFRISRYYSALTAAVAPASDTQIQLTSEPYNAQTLERLATDAGLSATTLPVAIFAPTGYSGIHHNFNQDDLLVEGCTFRGMAFDQCASSISSGMRVIGCRFEYGQDVGITSGSPTNVNSSFTAVGNHFRCQGTSAIWHAGDGGSIQGNTVNSWGGASSILPGAIQVHGTAVAVVGNTFRRLTTAGQGGQSSYAIAVLGTGPSVADTIFLSGNADMGSRVGTLNIVGTVTNLHAADARVKSTPVGYAGPALAGTTSVTDPFVAPGATPTGSSGFSAKNGDFVYVAVAYQDSAGTTKIGPLTKVTFTAASQGVLFAAINTPVGGATVTNVKYYMSSALNPATTALVDTGTATAPTANVAAATTINALAAGSAAPAVNTTNTGAGVNPSVTVVGNDNQGVITVVSNGSGTLGSGIALRLVFGTAYETAPEVMVSAASSNGAGKGPYADASLATVTKVEMGYGASALTVGQTCVLAYRILEAKT